MSSTSEGLAAELQQERDHRLDVLEVQDLLGEGRAQAQLGVELEPAHPREVVLLRVQEHPLEEVARGVEGRGIARTHPPVDLDERLLGRLDGVLLDRRRTSWARSSSRSGKKTSKALIWLSSVLDDGEDAGADGLVALEHHLARLGVDDVGDRVGALEVGLGDLHLLEPQLLHLLEDGER